MNTRPEIAVIGAGLMGHGIAWIFAAGGWPVRIFDPDPGARHAVQRKLSDISQLLETAHDAVERVQVCETLETAVYEAAFVFEAAPENLELKRRIFTDLCRLTPSACILATNTSALPIGRISEGLSCRERIVGTHFWNPPHLVPLVEVVEVEGVNGAVVAPMMTLLREAGRHPVHARKDVPGFIGNRLQHALKREAIALVANGVCDAETIDDVVKLGFGRRLAVLGPMEQSDLVGLDLTASIHATIMPDLDNTDTVHPYLRERVQAGDLGMKTGRGFRRWTNENAAAVRRRLSDFLAASVRDAAADTRET